MEKKRAGLKKIRPELQIALLSLILNFTAFSVLFLVPIVWTEESTIERYEVIIVYKEDLWYVLDGDAFENLNDLLNYFISDDFKSLVQEKQVVRLTIKKNEKVIHKGQSLMKHLIEFGFETSWNEERVETMSLKNFTR